MPRNLGPGKNVNDVNLPTEEERQQILAMVLADPDFTESYKDQEPYDRWSLDMDIKFIDHGRLDRRYDVKWWFNSIYSLMFGYFPDEKLNWKDDTSGLTAEMESDLSWQLENEHT